MFGPDATSSLNMKEIKWLATSVKQVTEGMKESGLKENDTSFIELKSMFGRSLAINKNLPAGTVLALNHLESKKPANQGISVKEFEQVIGKTLKHNITQWAFLQWEDLH
jgi:N-acetylneuraminate synthase